MKKLLALVVLALVVPAMADVDVTLLDNEDGSGTIQIAISGGAVVRGIALTVDTDGATVGDATNGENGDTSDYNAAMNCFMDFASDNPTGYDLYGEVGAPAQHPLAAQGAAGVPTFPTDSFSICMGSLDQSGAQGGLVDSGDLVTIQFSDAADVILALDTFRGGIVGDDLGNVTVTGNSVTVGTACLGDFNGDGAVNGSDVPGFIATFGLTEGQTGYVKLGDFNGDNAVNGSDVPGFVAVFGSLCP